MNSFTRTLIAAFFVVLLAAPSAKAQVTRGDKTLALAPLVLIELNCLQSSAIGSYPSVVEEISLSRELRSDFHGQINLGETPQGSGVVFGIALKPAPYPNLIEVDGVGIEAFESRTNPALANVSTGASFTKAFVEKGSYIFLSGYGGAHDTLGSISCVLRIGDAN